MFEALFILTTMDAGTRVGRFMLQDFLGHFWEPLGRTSWCPSVLITSAGMVGAWGYFLYQGVIDPLGGINSLWPLFGISNQLLAAIALSVATTLIIKSGRARYAWTTLLPLALAAGGDPDRRVPEDLQPGACASGFWRTPALLSDQLAAGQVAAAKVAETHALIFNDRLDAAVTALFMVLVIVIVVDSLREWYRVLERRPGRRRRSKHGGAMHQRAASSDAGAVAAARWRLRCLRAQRLDGTLSRAPSRCC